MEAHGTGTVAGKHLEFTAFMRVVSNSTLKVTIIRGYLCVKEKDLKQLCEPFLSLPEDPALLMQYTPSELLTNFKSSW